MDFVYPFVSRRLVQAVDVLGHDAAQLVLLFQFVQIPMYRVGPGVRIDHIFSVKVKEYVRMKIKEGFAQNHFRGQPIVFFGIQPIGRSKIRNPAGSGHASTTKENDSSGAIKD